MRTRGQLSDELGELLYSDNGPIENLDQRISRRHFLNTARNVGIGLGIAYAGSRFGIGDVSGHNSAPLPDEQTVYLMHTAYSDKTIAIIDGQYDTSIRDTAKDDNGNDLPLNEWNDIVNIGQTFLRGQRGPVSFPTGTFGLKETDTAIQGYLDMYQQMSRQTDAAVIAIDPLHNAGDFPQEDDYKFAVVKTQSGYDVRVFQGTGILDTKWKSIDQPFFIKAAASYTKTPNFGQDHFFEEFEFNKIELRINPDKFGLAIYASSAFTPSTLGGFRWPSSADVDIPSTYGDVVSLKKPARVPEFPYSRELTLGITMLAGLEIMRRRKNILRKSYNI